MKNLDLAYGKWDELSELVGKKEQKELRSSYFDCQDFENVNSVVLLYYQNKFVTLLLQMREIFIS